MPKLNGKKYSLKTTTPNALVKLDEASDMLKEFNETSKKNYLFDEEFRGKFLKRIAEITMDFEDGMPSEEFFRDGELDIGEIQNARLNFLANGGMIGA